MADEPTIHSLLIAVEDGDPITAGDDEKLAQELQLQELLVVDSQNWSTSFGQGTVTEQGETSGTKLDEFDCNICMETKELTEQFATEACPHAFCNSCMSRYIAAEVEANAASVKCPDPQCKGSTAAPALHPDSCRSILPEAVFDRWGVALCESALGPRKFYCPLRDCSALVLKEEEDENMTDAECPHCKRMLCAACHVAWHEGISCEEFRRLDEEERGREDLMLRDLAKKSKWQRCPECKIYVERIDGCRFMSCRCGHCFCYGCATPMQPNNHFCVKCDNA